MRIRLTLHPLFTAAVLLTVLLPLGINAQDRVYPIQGLPASGKIKSLSPTAVTITARNKDQNFELKDVRKITFDNEPNGLDRARELILQNQYDQAMEELKKLSTDGIDNPLIVQDINFYRALSEGKLGLAGSGDKAAAVRGLLAIAQANRQTHHLYELSEMLGELALALGQPDQAGKYFGMLMSAPDTATKLRGTFRLAEVEMAKGDIEKAKKSFQQVASASINSPETIRIKNFADVGLALCMNESGESQEALNRLNAMIQKFDSTDQELFAKVNNAKGQCFLKLNQTNDALLSYLQTDLLFFTNAEAHAEALYQMSQLWPKVGEAARAAEARERLIQNYASSPWANK